MTTHLDHGLTPEQLSWVLDWVSRHEAFFIDTIELPKELGTVPCGLYGPLMKDAPVPESEVVYQIRGERTWTSRMCNRPMRPTRLITIIAGRSEPDGIMMLYTAFGGPCAPKEPGDPTVTEDQMEVSQRFWSQHALAL